MADVKQQRSIQAQPCSPTTITPVQAVHAGSDLPCPTTAANSQRTTDLQQPENYLRQRLSDSAPLVALRAPGSVVVGAADDSASTAPQLPPPSDASQAPPVVSAADDHNAFLIRLALAELRDGAQRTEAALEKLLALKLDGIARDTWARHLEQIIGLQKALLTEKARQVFPCPQQLKLKLRDPNEVPDSSPSWAPVMEVH